MNDGPHLTDAQSTALRMAAVEYLRRRPELVGRVEGDDPFAASVEDERYCRRVSGMAAGTRRVLEERGLLERETSPSGGVEYIVVSDAGMELARMIYNDEYGLDAFENTLVERIDAAAAAEREYEERQNAFRHRAMLVGDVLSGLRGPANYLNIRPEDYPDLGAEIVRLFERPDAHRPEPTEKISLRLQDLEALIARVYAHGLDVQAGHEVSGRLRDAIEDIDMQVNAS